MIALSRMAGTWASAMASSAHTITSTNSAMAPMNLRRRSGMANTLNKRHNAPLRGQGAALYGPRFADKRAIMSAGLSDSIQGDDLHAGDLHARAIRLWLYAVALLVFALVLVGGATRLTESGLSITEWRPV